MRISLILGLDDYIREIFRQLDYKHTGSVTREDFTLLCEVLGLNTTPPTSKRNSGLEWLASYRPRPNSPGSPLRWKLYYYFYLLQCLLYTISSKIAFFKCIILKLYLTGSAIYCTLFRLDKLKDVKYKHNGPKPLVKEHPTSFLWTLGPRPFWELWPNKKRRKKHLNVDEFAKCLLEQWAKTYG